MTISGQQNAIWRTERLYPMHSKVAGCYGFPLQEQNLLHYVKISSTKPKGSIREADCPLITALLLWKPVHFLSPETATEKKDVALHMKWNILMIPVLIWGTNHWVPTIAWMLSCRLLYSKSIVWEKIFNSGLFKHLPELLTGLVKHNNNYIQLADPLILKVNHRWQEPTYFLFKKMYHTLLGHLENPIWHEATFSILRLFMGHFADCDRAPR